MSRCKHTTLGYATYSRRSALVMRAIDSLNPFKSHVPFQWHSPCLISSVDGIGDLIIQLPLIQGMLSKAKSEGVDAIIALRPNGFSLGRALGWPVIKFENPLQLFFKKGLGFNLLGHFKKQYNSLRTNRPAMWIDLTGNAVNALFIKSIGVSKLASKVTRGGCSFTDMVIPHDVFLNEYDYQAAVASYFDVDYDRSVYGQLLPQVNPKNYIILSVTTPFRWKSWPLRNFADIARRFKNERFLVTGLSSELQPGESDSLNLLIDQPNVINLIDRLSLLQLAQKISAARAIVTGDTSTLHMAGAFDVPGAAIFGPSDSALWMPPKGPKLFKSPYCPYHPCKQWACEDIPNWCLTKIDLDAVFTHLESVLANTGAQ